MIMEMRKNAKGFLEYAKSAGFDILHYTYNQVIVSNEDISGAARVCFDDMYVYISPLVIVSPFKTKVLSYKGLFYFDIGEKNDSFYEKIIVDILTRLDFTEDSVYCDYNIYDETGLFTYNPKTGEYDTHELQEVIEGMPEKVIFNRLAKITTENRYVDEKSGRVFSILRFIAEGGSYFTYDTKYKKISGSTVLIPSSKKAAADSSLLNKNEETVFENLLAHLLNFCEHKLSTMEYSDYIRENLGEAVDVVKHRGNIYDLDNILHLKKLLGMNVSYELYSFINSEYDSSLLELSEDDKVYLIILVCIYTGVSKIK